MKRTYQPSKIRRARTHGFRARMATPNGRAILRRRRAKGRQTPERLSRVGSCPFAPLCRGFERRRLTLPRQSRIRRRVEFTACYERGRRYHTEHFLVFALSRKQHGVCTRTGTAVSRKVGNAVVRNRVKRLLREFFRLHCDALPVETDIVTVAKRHAGTAALDLSAWRPNFCPCCGGWRVLNRSVHVQVECDAYVAALVVRFAHPPLPALHLARAASRLPLLPHLFRLRRGGHSAPRRAARRLAGAQASGALPSMGRVGL